MHGLACRVGSWLGDRIILNSPVDAIEQTGTRVRVHAAGRTWEASRVVVAAPPALTLDIDFQPGLPARRAQLLGGMPMGSVIKVHVAYPRPFWRDAGLSGEALSVESDLSPVFDATPVTGTPGILLGFIEGEAARRWTARDPVSLRAMVVRELQRYFGPEAATPIDVTTQDWLAERWTRGCYASVMPPGVLSTVGDALREPFDRVHWAGTETATAWVGYVDGAIRSGRRAAREVASAFGKETVERGSGRGPAPDAPRARS